MNNMIGFLCVPGSPKLFSQRLIKPLNFDPITIRVDDEEMIDAIFWIVDGWIGEVLSPGLQGCIPAIDTLADQGQDHLAT